MRSRPAFEADRTAATSMSRSHGMSPHKMEFAPAADLAGPGLIPPSERAAGRSRAWVLCSSLVAVNVCAWICALIVFRSNWEALGVCAVVYGLGLRHAVDADHITAIDNVTRKLMAEGKQSVAAGLFFALGHSTIVIIVTLIVALAAGSLANFEAFRGAGGVISTLVSGTFLVAIAIMNLNILLMVSRRTKSGHGHDHAPPTLLTRMVQPILRLVRHSWHMFPVGFLFGLGFDTATEVAMFGVSAAQASKGFGLASVLIFPILFTAGMSLIDTLDGVAMMHAYRWAFVKPERKRVYNLTITLISALAAACIGVIELVGLLPDALPRDGWAIAAIHGVMDNINAIGLAMLGMFLGAWLLSYAARGSTRMSGSK